MGDNRNEETRRRQKGWIGALAALLGLVAVGFLGGALIGFLWEEPRLVLAYLRGDTETVEWSEPTPARAPDLDPADVSAPPPADPETEEAAPSPGRPAPAETKPAPVEAQPAPAPPPAAKPAPEPSAPAETQTAARTDGRFAVQVGAFQASASAESLVERLRGRGYSAYLAPAPSGDARWRVRVGPFPTRPEAEALAEELKRAEDLSTWVLDENAT